VHAEDLLVDDCGDREAVEAVGKCLPELDVVPSLACAGSTLVEDDDNLDLANALTFVVKAVDAVDACAFVVAAEDEEVFRVFDLVCQQQADGFERLLPAVDIVAKKEVVCFRGETTILEQPEEIIVLPVDIAYHGQIFD
jgi:hypothetical protein